MKRQFATGLILALGIVGCKVQPTTTASGPKELVLVDIEKLPIEKAMLGFAPKVAPPVARDHQARVVVELEATERIGRLADGVEYLFWTFGDTVPGPMIRVRQGDYVELHMKNHEDSKLPHNIDLHAVKGPGGGAEATLVAPGEHKSFSFRALKPGVYVYHCATPPVGMHVANGMYGLIVVEPEEGLAAVDREYYVMQSEFYTKGNFGEPGLQEFSADRAMAEDPGYVVFNGAVGALTGDNAMKANVGERVRLFVGNGGPNLVSSFHVIGEVFETVYHEGGLTKNHNVQTTLIPAGGATMVEFSLKVPGDYLLVDHSLFRAFNKGALGMLKVEGKENLALFRHGAHDKRGVEEAAVQTADSHEGHDETEKAPVNAVKPDESAAVEVDGGKVYARTCASCHMPDGTGLKGTFPALTGSKVAMDDKQAVQTVLRGRRGNYGFMPPHGHLSDEEVAAVLTHIRKSFGNEGEPVKAEDVKALRGS